MTMPSKRPAVSKIQTFRELYDGPRQSQFNIRLSDEELAKLKATAATQGLTASEVARQAIRAAVGLPCSFAPPTSETTLSSDLRTFIQRFEAGEFEGKRLFKPGYWCEPDTAKAYLESTGWKIVGKRARRGSVSIPAPQAGSYYDLHDVSCEEDVGASEMIQQIRTWAGRNDVCGGPWGPRPG